MLELISTSFHEDVYDFPRYRGRVGEFLFELLPVGDHPGKTILDLDR